MKNYDRILAFPGALGIRIHGDRRGVTLFGPAVGRETYILRHTAAQLIRSLREAHGRQVLKGRDQCLA